ncbi:MAG: hypothetical protein EPN86_05435 [Nanoarchaeota archaeon]|nr:MAG: hypothetical protein EPN86_05435 [Nanoarchaeota archaeon]
MNNPGMIIVWIILAMMIIAVSVEAVEFSSLEEKTEALHYGVQQGNQVPQAGAEIPAGCSV